MATLRQHWITPFAKSVNAKQSTCAVEQAPLTCELHEKVLQHYLSSKKHLQTPLEVSGTCRDHVSASMRILLYILLVKRHHYFLSPIQRYVLVTFSTYKQSWHLNSSLCKKLGIFGVLGKESSNLYSNNSCGVPLLTCSSLRITTHQYGKFDVCVCSLVLCQ